MGFQHAGVEANIAGNLPTQRTVHDRQGIEKLPAAERRTSRRVGFLVYNVFVVDNFKNMTVKNWHSDQKIGI